MSLVDSPTPSFVHFGIEGGTTSIYPLTFRNEPSILVGSLHGKCLIYSLRTNLLMDIVYDDSHNRHIVSLGELQYETENSSYRKFWVHFRGSSVEIFKLLGEELKNGAKFEKIRHISSEHYGFAKTFFDSKSQRLVVPDSINTENVIKLRYENGGEQIFTLTTDYLQKNLIDADSKNRKVSDMFKGCIMGVEAMEDPNRLLLGLEDSLLVFDLKMKYVVTYFKHVKYNNLMTFCSHFDPMEKLTRILVSVVGRLFSLTYAKDTLDLDKLLKNTKKSEIDCNTIAFSPTGTQVACGFSNGYVEIFSLPDYQQIYTTMDYQEKSIFCLSWFELEETSKNSKETRPEFLCVGSEDGKLVLYNNFEILN